MWRKFSLCAGTLTSRWYTPQTGYSDFFSTVAAAETFERIRRDKQTVNLKKGLCELVSAVGKPFRDLVADVNRWASCIAKTRDNYVVHPGLCGNPDGEDLYWKTELGLHACRAPAAAGVRVAGGGSAERRQLRADEKTRERTCGPS